MFRLVSIIFFFKQKTAYEMRISDWSSDVCSSDLHLKKTIGVDHIGLGGDYDGMDSAPVGLEDVAGYPALFAELARRGYSKSDLKKIASGNMLRVLKAVEAYAASQTGQIGRAHV